MKQNLRLLRVLLSPADESIFIGLPVAGEAVDLRVGSQGAFIVNVAAADGPDAPGVRRVATVLRFGHGGASRRAIGLARRANVSNELVDSSPPPQKKKSP